MKKTILFITVILIAQICRGQVDTTERGVYCKEFKWKISIPEGFVNITPEQYAKLQQKGTEVLEKASNGKIENNTTRVFAFKTDQFHYFESNYQPFDPLKDGDFATSCRSVYDIIYAGLKKQLPEGTKMDSTISTEVIDHLIFQRFEMKLNLNKLVLTMLMYNRLFDKKDLTISIFYADKSKGDLILNSWRNSKFE